MTLSVNITNNGRRSASIARVIAIVAVCSAGSTAAPYEFEPGNDVPESIGYGPGQELTEEVLRQPPGPDGAAKVIYQKVTGSIAGVVGSVTETPSGSGPTITVSGTPYDSYNVAVKITKGGALGTAVCKVALDAIGGPTRAATYGDEIPIAVRVPAAFLSAIDLTGITLADLNGLTLIATSDIGGPITVTFTTPSSIEDIATQITTQSAVSTDEFAARIVSGKYLQVYSLTDGAASTLSFGAGTANTILGLTASVTYSGADSTYAIPNTGLTITFPHSSDYVVDTVYTFTATQPRFSVSAMNTALSTLKAWASTNGVALEHVFVMVDPADGTEARAFADAIGLRRAEFYAAPYRRFANFYMGAPLHTASATQSTNEANIATTDADVKAAFGPLNHIDPYLSIMAGDCYMAGRFGKLRRSLMAWIALFQARERDTADPGNRSLPGFSSISLLGPDGVTLARNEITATHKMQAARFTAAKREGGVDFIVRGVTRADPAQTPQFKHMGVVNLALRTARIMTPFAQRYENTDPFLTAAGRIRDDEADAIEKGGTAELQEQLVQREHASDAVLTVDRSENIGSTENLTLAAQVQNKGQILNVSLTVGVSDTFEVSGA